MPHLARNLYYPQATAVSGSPTLNADGGSAEEYVFSSDGTLDRPLDVLLVKQDSVPDFFYIREGSDRPVRSVSVRLDNGRNLAHRTRFSAARSDLDDGTALLAVPDGLLYAPQRVWFQHTAEGKSITRSLKEDNLKLVLYHSDGYDLICTREGRDESRGDLSVVGDFDGTYTAGVAQGWSVTGGVPFKASASSAGVSYVLTGTASQGVTAQPGSTVLLTMNDDFRTLMPGADYEFRVNLFSSAPVGTVTVQDAGTSVNGTLVMPQPLRSRQQVRTGLWSVAAGVFRAEQSYRADGSLVYTSDGTTPVAAFRPQIEVTIPADAPGPVTLHFDAARVRRVTQTRYDMEVTGFAVPVGGVGEDGEEVLPLFSDVLEPEDIARRLLRRFRGVLGEADDPENPAWAIMVGVAYAQWPQYLWTAFKQYRIDPSLCPHRELRSLAAMMGEPMFYGLEPDERRQYVTQLLDLIRAKGSSYCLLRLCRIMGVNSARITKINTTDPGFRWHYAIFLNAKLGQARLSTLRKMFAHWSPAFMSYEIVEGNDPWVLDRSQLDNETTLADAGTATK